MRKIERKRGRQRKHFTKVNRQRKEMQVDHKNKHVWKQIQKNTRLKKETDNWFDRRTCRQAAKLIY